MEWIAGVTADFNISDYIGVHAARKETKKDRDSALYW